jgi:16S rRNA (adenine1518-N6/adenine1519-N6)-dimethyltransferase
MSGARAEDGLPPLREVIAEHGLSARKGLGQNFILDLNVTRRIARAASVSGKQVYEVGPGPGGLTRALLIEGASGIVAVERDARCLPALEAIRVARPGYLNVVNDDAMKVDEPALLRGLGVPLPVHVVANLPFNVGTALLVKWLTLPAWPPWWTSLTLMFQREVADRIVARPDTEAYGRLSVLAQWRAQPRILFNVGRQVFVPPPKVGSSVVRIDPLPAPGFAAELGDLEKVTAAAFGQRRKMLRNNLKALSPDAEALLADADIEGTARAEELGIEQFAALARAYARLTRP